MPAQKGPSLVAFCHFDISRKIVRRKICDVRLKNVNVRYLPLCSQKQPEPPAEVPTDLPLTPSALESLEAKAAASSATPETPTTPGGTRKTVTFNLEQNQTTTIESSTAHKRQQSPKTKRKTLGQVKRVRQLARLGWFFSTSTSSSTPYHLLSSSLCHSLFLISALLLLSHSTVFQFFLPAKLFLDILFFVDHFFNLEFQIDPTVGKNLHGWKTI